MKLYLDTSVILKRYLTETGSEIIDLIFDKAETGELVITISLWNIGEVLGVLDGNRRKCRLTEEEFEAALDNFGQELVKLIRLKTLEVIPILHSDSNRCLGSIDESSCIRGRRTSNSHVFIQPQRCTHKR